MSEKEGGQGVFSKIFIGVAIPVLTAVILYNLGMKDSKPERPPAPPESAQPVNPVDPSKVTDKPKPPESTQVMNPVDTKTANSDLSSTSTTQPALPASSCPAVQGMFLMQYPNSWYGPFAGGDAVSFSSAGGFFVYNAQMPNAFGTLGAVVPYPDPYNTIQRNVWLPLQQSRFYVCVDSSNNVFGGPNNETT